MSSLVSQYLGDEAPTYLLALGIGFIAWNILNIIVMNLNLPDKHLSREEYLDMRNRMVSFVHGTISMLISGYNTYFLQSQCGEKNTELEQWILIFSASYFLYDMLAMAYLGILDRSMFIHHNICVWGMTIGILLHTSGNILVAALFVSEISNPAMHVRVVLKHLNRRYTKAYECAELSYILLYIYGRVFMGVSNLIRTLSCPENPIIVKILGVGIILQSFFFIYRMIFILKTRAAEYSERMKKGVKMRWFSALTKEEISQVELYNAKTKIKVP